jgi:ComEC/Rec2-related protein
MNRPLVAVVVAYATGLLLAQWFHPPLPWLFGLTGFLLVLVLVIGFAQQRTGKLPVPLIFIPLVTRHPSLVTRSVLWPLLALIAWTNFAARTSVIAPMDLRAVLGQQPAAVAMRGTLAETPHLKMTVQGEREKWRNVARVRVQQIRLTNDFAPASGEVLITTPDVLGPDFFSGQPVEINGVIAPPPPPLAEGLFDYRDYLATRGIYFQLKTESTNDWRLREPHLTRPPLTDRFLTWSQHTLALGLPGEDGPLRLLWAMTLGWRTAFTGDIDEPFLRAGTMHMFAIDGLRIALVSGMIVTLLRVLRLSRAWCGLVAIPVIWFYTAATGWEASAIRASVMMTIVLGGWALKRPGDLLNSLAAAAFIILLADPRQLDEASFQLSFFVMLVIALMLPPLNAFTDRLVDLWLRPDPLVPDALLPGWRVRLLSSARHFLRFSGLSFAAWMGSLPLSAKYFHLFSPVSTPANVVAVPLGTLALTANLGALICGHWLPWFTALFNHAAWFFMVAMTWVSVEAARLPAAYYYVAEPSWFTIALYYAVIIAAFSGWFNNAWRKKLGVSALGLIAAGYFCHWQISRAETDLTVLPLEGGQVVYVDADGRRNDWLINCGSASAANSTLRDFLRAQGVNTLPRLVLADGNARNCGGAKQLDDLFHIGELWTGAVKFRTPAYRAALAEFKDKDRPQFYGRPQGLWPGETNGCWQALFPVATTNAIRAGDAALVLRGTFHGTRILLLSELSRAGQSDLLAPTNDLRADIVIAGLPDNDEPLCDDLIAAIRPRVIVIADSEYPATRRASPGLHERLAQSKIPVIYTRTAGAVTIVTDKTGWRLRTMDGQKFASQ